MQTCYIIAENSEVDQTEAFGKKIGDAVKEMARQANKDFRYLEGPADQPRYENGCMGSDYSHNKTIEDVMQKKIQQLCGGKTVTAWQLNHYAYWYAKCLDEPGDYCARIGEFEGFVLSYAMKAAREMQYLNEQETATEVMVDREVDITDLEQIKQVCSELVQGTLWRGSLFPGNEKKEEAFNKSQEAQIFSSVKPLCVNSDTAQSLSYHIAEASRCLNKMSCKYDNSCINDRARQTANVDWWANRCARENREALALAGARQ